VFEPCRGVFRADKFQGFGDSFFACFFGSRLGGAQQLFNRLLTRICISMRFTRLFEF
jgi:hypothetical protein